MVKPSSIEIAVGSFVGPNAPPWRWLEFGEAMREIKRAEAADLVRRGIIDDPFTLPGHPGHRRYRRVKGPVAKVRAHADPFDVLVGHPTDIEGAAAAEENTADPFDVTVVIEDPVGVEWIPWSEDDQAAAARFEEAQTRERLEAGLSASDRWLSRRDPFNVSLRRQAPIKSMRDPFRVGRHLQ